MSVISIIPARGGSKGIKGKNLKVINGKPMIVHSILDSLNNEMIDRTIVSTDSPEIAEIAKKYGAEVPFIRPAELAEDHVLDLPVFRHAIVELDLCRDDILVHLRPTSPFRKNVWISTPIQKLLEDSSATSIRSVHLVSDHPYRMFKAEDGILVPYDDRLDKPYELRRQEWPDLYYYNCVVDVTRVSTIIEHGSMVGDRILPYIIGEKDCFDIDTIDDFNRLETFWRAGS